MGNVTFFMRLKQQNDIVLPKNVQMYNKVLWTPEDFHVFHLGK